MKAKPRILFITWSFSRGGGAERVLSNLICELEKTGCYDISLLEVSHESIAWEQLPESVTVLPPVLDETNNAPAYRLKRYRRRKQLEHDPDRVRDIVRKGKRFDLAVGFNYLYPTYLIYEDEPSISWNHGTIWELKDQPERLELQRKAYEHIDAIVAIAQRTKESIAGLYPEFENKLHVIPNGFRFSDIYERAEEPCDVLDGTPILAVGRLDENKNPLGILNAFEAIRERRPDCHLYYLGDGDLRSDVEREIAQRGLSSCVSFLGHQKNPYPYMRQGACILTMSHSEGFQTVIVEGLALGVPFISTPVGSAEELSCGQLFGKTVETPEAAGDAFEALSSASCGESWNNDMRRFVERYSIDSQVGAFVQLANNLIEGTHE